MTPSCKSIRECEYYNDYLFDNYRDFKQNESRTISINSYNKHLASEINFLKISQKIQSLMQSKFKEEDQVSLSQLDWLNADNGRACNWLWSLRSKRTLNFIITNRKISANNEERFKAMTWSTKFTHPS